jgi:choline dehydrogenase-like flavoprotein
MNTTIYDVCVIGSGASGGVLAKELAESGAKVALIEAGRDMKAEDFAFHTWPYEYPFKGTSRGARPPYYPREVAEAIRYEDSDDIGVDHVRAVGGRTIHWNAVCLRFGPSDFRERSLAGVEEDWPISYEELAPYYSYVEKMIGVTGTKEGLEIVPDGEYLPPLRFRCSEMIVQRACKRMGIPMFPARKAVTTVPFDGRPACHYCGRCMQGCDVGAVFNTARTMIPKAQRTGNFTLFQNKAAREILVDRDGKAHAVSVVDTVTRREEEIRGRFFALCCGTVQSTRLLLNSRSPRFPNGLANSSGVLGRYFSGHVATEVCGYLEELVGTRPVNIDGATDHSYIPRFKKAKDYVGGFHYQMQFKGFMFPHHAMMLKGFGKSFKKQVRELYPALFQMAAFGKVMANPDNRVIVDPNQLDAYGIPIPVIRFRWGPNELAMCKDMVGTAHEILNEAKCRVILDTYPTAGGLASHEVGTARMGNDRKTSVLNAHNQAHDVKNLFVTDGSSFVTFPEKNPTLTIMALSVRAARFMTDAVRKGDL